MGSLLPTQMLYKNAGKSLAIFVSRTNISSIRTVRAARTTAETSASENLTGTLTMKCRRKVEVGSL